MTHDLNQKAAHWKEKQTRLKRTVIGAGFVLLAVLFCVLWNLSQGVPIAWLPILLFAGAALGTILIAMSTLTNTTLAAMYYTACVRFLEKSDELELVTGSIETVNTLRVPTIGVLYQVTLNVAGSKQRFYMPSRVLTGVCRDERVRVLAHDLIAVRVENTGFALTQARETTQSA